MPTRRYQQRIRAETAEQTRRQILDAMYDRLRASPVEPVSVDRVAQHAGVSRSTVYLLFDSRAGLFDALGADLLEHSGFHRVMDSLTRPDARDSLREGFAGIAAMYATHRDVLRVLHSMSAIDPDSVGGSIPRMESGRASGMAYLAERLADQGELSPGVTRRGAADLLWLLTSFESFDLLHTARGLDAEQTADTLADTAQRALLR